MPQVNLSNLTIDYEQFTQQFASDLLTRDQWTDLSPTGTGVTIIQWLSSLGAYEIMAIERSLQETMLDTARQPNSIYTIARMLGVHVFRKVPGSCTVSLANSSAGTAVSIASYSQFMIQGRYYFNREPFIFNINDTNAQVVTLYQGQVQFEQIVAQGGDFQRYYIGGPGINISDQDVFATLQNGTILVKSTTDALWTFPYNSPQFFENSMPDFTVECAWGNTTYGIVPAINDVITFYYTVTNGLSGNYAVSGENVTTQNYPTITGLTLSPTVGGADEKTIDFYRVFGPMLFSANRRMVTRDDYRATTLTYPGVLDCFFLGQADVDPTRLEWMNAIQYTILAVPAWTDAQHATFVQWVKTVGIYQTRLQRQDPVAVPVDVIATVSCTNRANLSSIQKLIIQAINSLFILQPGSLGYSMYQSDITTVISNVSQDIEYIDLQSPSMNVIVNSLQYVTLNSVTITMAYTDRVPH